MGFAALGYTADVLQSAQSLADHASRPGPPKIEKEDVELSIQLRKRYEFFEPPPRDVSPSLLLLLRVNLSYHLPPPSPTCSNPYD